MKILLNKDMGVILNGSNEVISVELESNNKNFYYLRYYRCAKRPGFYTIVLTKDTKKKYFKCFRCGGNHQLKLVSKIFIDWFNNIHNLLIYSLGSQVEAANESQFLKVMIESLKKGDFNVV